MVVGFDGDIEEGNAEDAIVQLMRSKLKEMAGVKEQKIQELEDKIKLKGVSYSCFTY